jgi:nitroreductase/NAD-dependent dihydropyrimidine dehydrogenase PreA subunit
MTKIIVDQDRCTRCSICSKICPLGLVDSADENHLPQVTESKASGCINCGHCEVFCPSGALTLDFALDEKRDGTIESAEISPDNLGTYLKTRRSVRHYTAQKVEKEKIEQIMDIVRYAASGMNSQPVQWIVVYDEKEVKRLSGLTIDWMRYLSESKNPMSAYAIRLIAAWERGIDPICYNAPHLLIAHISENNPVAPTDAIIALTHFDIAAPAFGLGTCWAGFLAGAGRSWKPMQEALALPTGRAVAYAMMFGYPQYKTYSIPRRNPVQVVWR